MNKTETRPYGIKAAEKMVKQQQEIGNDVRWDGWDIIFFRPSEYGRTDSSGAFRDGTWGFDNRFVVDSEGKWNIDVRNLRRVRRTGNRR